MAPMRLRALLTAATLLLGGLFSTGCGQQGVRDHATIGIVNYVPVMGDVVTGFKERMAQLGYVEGRNATYLYAGVLDAKTDAIEREVRMLRERKVDLLLALGTRPALAAKAALAGTGIPVVFAPVVNPVEEGLVDSIARPGGQVTGVQNGDILPKSLEWLQAIVPTQKRIHVVYHRRDQVARTSLTSLQAAAPALGLQLVAQEAADSAQAVAFIRTLPSGSALFLVPTPSLIPLEAMLDVAAERGIAVGTTTADYLVSRTLMTFGPDFVAIGRQAARLADQILRGSRPSELPVETPEYSLKVNLQMARRIGIEVPDRVVDQAHKVLR